MTTERCCPRARKTGCSPPRRPSERQEPEQPQINADKRRWDHWSTIFGANFPSRLFFPFPAVLEEETAVLSACICVYLRLDRALKTPLVIANPWEALRRHTPARIALGRAGPALPTKEVLEFGLAHARARDAVHLALDTDRLEEELKAAGYAPVRVKSRAADRATYLTRPDRDAAWTRRAHGSLRSDQRSS
jgi:hypothetical protein